MKKLDFKHTILSCFIAYTVQAIVCNFAPLLFVGWENEFNISFAQLTSIITLTFFTQIVVDLAAASFAHRVGYKNCLISAHIFSSIGFFLLAFLPYIMSNSFTGIVISVIIYSIGSGLLEVIVSPIVEGCPTDNKAAAMSLLHSFYCWGTVAVIAFTTLFMLVFGRENWRYLSIIWSVFSILNGLFVTKVPINEPQKEKNSKGSLSLFKSKLFIIAIVLMICSGASELAMSQWASTLAESGLKVSKAIGDIAGPMAFAVLMGSGRIIFSKLANKISTEKYLIFSSISTIISYLLVSLSSSPILSLIGCAFCGFAVSAMWPATISLTTAKIKNAPAAMFAFLALSGDVGCTSGPTAIGIITNYFNGNLKLGLIFSIIFPMIIIISLTLLKDKKK